MRLVAVEPWRGSWQCPWARLGAWASACCSRGTGGCGSRGAPTGAPTHCRCLSQDGRSRGYFNLLLRLYQNCRVNEDYTWLRIFLHQTAFQWKVKCLTCSSRMFTRICLQFAGTSSDVAQLEILIKYQCMSIYSSRFLGWMFQQGRLTKFCLCEKVDKISVIHMCFYFCLACSDNFFKATKILLSFPATNRI